MKLVENTIIKIGFTEISFQRNYMIFSKTGIDDN